MFFRSVYIQNRSIVLTSKIRLHSSYHVMQHHFMGVLSRDSSNSVVYAIQNQIENNKSPIPLENHVNHVFVPAVFCDL